jgi:hypothetical protein
MDDGLNFQAVRHVLIENGNDRTRVNQAMIDFSAEDPAGTIKTE